VSARSSSSLALVERLIESSGGLSEGGVANDSRASSSPNERSRARFALCRLRSCSINDARRRNVCECESDEYPGEVTVAGLQLGQLVGEEGLCPRDAVPGPPGEVGADKGAAPSDGPDPPGSGLGSDESDPSHRQEHQRK
jgi:hypothetical protein